MVVRGKPKSTAQKTQNVEDFIQKGGSAAQETEASHDGDEAEVRGLKLRLPAELLKEVDEAVDRRRPVPSRHQWILEAIYEKLEREISV
jgi:hypothetical protein